MLDLLNVSSNSLISSAFVQYLVLLHSSMSFLGFIFCGIQLFILAVILFISKNASFFSDCSFSITSGWGKGYSPSVPYIILIYFLKISPLPLTSACCNMWYMWVLSLSQALCGWIALFVMNECNTFLFSLLSFNDKTVEATSQCSAVKSCLSLKLFKNVIKYCKSTKKLMKNGNLSP